MAKARYLVEAHLVEGRSVAELAAAHGVHRSWIYKLLTRYREGGYEALEPRSRAPRSSPQPHARGGSAAKSCPCESSCSAGTRLRR